MLLSRVTCLASRVAGRWQHGPRRLLSSEGRSVFTRRVTRRAALTPAGQQVCAVLSVQCARFSATQRHLSASVGMEKERVVPDVIPVPPAGPLTVSYSSGVTVESGAELTPTQVKGPPQLTWDADPNALYTVILTDPDAPSRADPKFGEWRHWLVVNVPGGDVTKGEAVSEYVGSGPPEGTGLHRYVFLVYKQPGKITPDSSLKQTKNQAKARAKWRAAKFAEEHKLGNPVAGNFYQAKWDDYVPELYKQLTG